MAQSAKWNKAEKGWAPADEGFNPRIKKLNCKNAATMRRKVLPVIRHSAKRRALSKKL